MTDENISYDCIRCGCPTDGSVTFGQNQYVCFDLYQCVENQKSIHEATTNWKPIKLRKAELLK